MLVFQVLQTTVSIGPTAGLVRRVEEGELLEVLDGPKEELGPKGFNSNGGLQPAFIVKWHVETHSDGLQPVMFSAT